MGYGSCNVWNAAQSLILRRSIFYFSDMIFSIELTPRVLLIMGNLFDMGALLLLLTSSCSLVVKN